MATASAIRLQIESALAHRFPAALTPVAKAIRPVMPTGIAAVDEVLAGGLPLGAIAEFVGPESSGRTAAAFSTLARLTQTGRVAAWIDVENAFDPESAAAAGVDLARLLWVRCGVAASAGQLLRENAFQLPQKFFVPPAAKKGLHGGGFGPHPRTETKGLPEAVSELLRAKSFAPRCAEPQAKHRSAQETIAPVSLRHAGQAGFRVSQAKPWKRIEQALRVADLVLQAGGFAFVVIDMGGIAPEYVTRVPMATWFRYRAAAERAQSSLLLLTQYPCARSSAELLLRFENGRPSSDEATVFTGIEHRVVAERSRFTHTPAPVVAMRKPPQREFQARGNSAQWRSRSSWAGAR